MEIYKNKSSGNYFIYIDDTDTADGALFVTPGCKVIPLKFGLFFDEIKEGNDDDFVSDGLITKTQLDRYRQYNNDRNNESGDRFEDINLVPSRPIKLKGHDSNDKQQGKEPDMVERMAKDIRGNKPSH